ncbi:MAG: class I SAM-dependent methyltransferase [bacterium]
MDKPKPQVFYEIHKDIPREGPGDNESTRQAFSMLSELSDSPHILEIGCGPGMQTIELAQMTNGLITALDNQKRFLDELEKRAKVAHVEEKIKTVEGSMFALPFSEKSFDLIWAEGAIYIIGFREGLIYWKSFLKENGYIAVTHISWLKDNIPDEPKKFWAEGYPAIATVEKNLEIVEQCGYKNIGHFALPASAWWNDYYTPLEARLKMLREKYKDDKESLDRINQTQREIDLYKNYSDYYGYVFYLMQKAS